MWWWRCTAWSRETKKDAVAFYASWAHAGTHTLAYEAIAVTRGAFVLPPTKAAAALQPEVMGLSAGGTLRVSAATEPPVALADAEAAMSGKRCPGDCSGRGRCNPETGRCSCVAGAAGDDCSASGVAPTIGAANVNDTIDVPTGRAQPHVVMLPLDRAATTLYAISAAEELLASSALSLTAASTTSLRLEVRLDSSVAAGTCVRVTVAASADGLLFGSRVLALWLRPTAAAASMPPPASCVGDGQGYAPRPWETMSATPRLEWPRRSRSGLPPGLPIVAGLVVAATLALKWRRSRQYNTSHAGMRRLRDYPTAADAGHQSGADTPGSQSGAAEPPSEVEMDMDRVHARLRRLTEENTNTHDT